MEITQELEGTVAALVQPGKGILAADESLRTIGPRFKAAGVESTEETRRAYRSLMVTTPGIGEFLSGIIFFEETLTQTADDGTPLPQAAQRQGIVPGVKVDKGTVPLSGALGDLVTEGLDGLADRLKTYKAQGARFAKWREVYAISDHNPTALGLKANAEMLARYAATCQEFGIVPIVEPEVLLDGDHTQGQCAEVSEAVLHAVFQALHRHGVLLEATVLKPSMVLPGQEHARKAGPDEVARETTRVLRRVVPTAVPSINFLSGGQSAREATANLNAINVMQPHPPWALSFSYARALQQPVLDTWQGKPQNVRSAQQAFLFRARLNSAACRGLYTPERERVA